MGAWDTCAWGIKCIPLSTRMRHSSMATRWMTVSRALGTHVKADAATPALMRVAGNAKHGAAAAIARVRVTEAVPASRVMS
jgi:hypothetical protein